MGVANKTWQELLDERLSPQEQDEVAAETRRMLAEMPLADLRRARELTQEALASLLDRNQSSIAAMEKRTDTYVGTLRRYIEAMGGELEIIARFPGGDVRISQFSEAE